MIEDTSIGQDPSSQGLAHEIVQNTSYQSQHSGRYTFSREREPVRPIKTKEDLKDLAIGLGIFCSLALVTGGILWGLWALIS